MLKNSRTLQKYSFEPSPVTLLFCLQLNYFVVCKTICCYVNVLFISIVSMKTLHHFYFFLFYFLYTVSTDLTWAHCSIVFFGSIALFVVSSSVFTMTINFFTNLILFFHTGLRKPLFILPFLLIFVLCPSLKCARVIKLFYSCFVLFFESFVCEVT